MTSTNKVVIKKECTCPKCSKVVKDSDKALECEICDNWFHIKCEQLSDNEYKLIDEHKESNLHWFCSLCNINAVSIIKSLTSLKGRCDILEQDMTQVNSDMKIVKVDLSTCMSDVTIVKRDAESLAKELGIVNEKLALLETKLETSIEAKLLDSDGKIAEPLKRELEPL